MDRYADYPVSSDPVQLNIKTTKKIKHRLGLTNMSALLTGHVELTSPHYCCLLSSPLSFVAAYLARTLPPLLPSSSTIVCRRLPSWYAPFSFSFFLLSPPMLPLLSHPPQASSSFIFLFILLLPPTPLCLPLVYSFCFLLLPCSSPYLKW